MSNVIGIKGAAQDPDHVLEEAKGDFDALIIIGVDSEDMLDVRASLNLSDAEILWLIEKFKHNFISGEYDV
jgi:hypothetical protein